MEPELLDVLENSEVEKIGTDDVSPLLVQFLELPGLRASVLSQVGEPAMNGCTKLGTGIERQRTTRSG